MSSSAPRRGDFELLVQVAKAQRFKIIEKSDGHVTFTSPDGRLIKTRRSGVERGTGMGRAWENMIRRLRRIGFQWPPPKPVEAPSLMHAKKPQAPVAPRWPTRREKAAQNQPAAPPVEEESTAAPLEPTMANISAAPSSGVISDNELKDLAAAIAATVRPGSHDVVELANAAGVSSALIGALKNGKAPGDGNLSQVTAVEVRNAIERFNRGDRRPHPLAEITPKQRVVFRAIARAGRDVTISGLSELMGWSTSSVRSIIRPLLETGLLTRHGGPLDFDYRLTERGRALAAAYNNYSRQQAEPPKTAAAQPPVAVTPAPAPAPEPPPQPAQTYPDNANAQEHAAKTSEAITPAASTAGQVFAELFEQELKARTGPLEAHIAELQAKVEELRGLLMEEQKRSSESSRSREELVAKAMAAAERAIRASLSQSGSGEE